MQHLIKLLPALLVCVFSAGCLESPEPTQESSTEASLKIVPVPPPQCYPENTCGPEFTCLYEFEGQCDAAFCRQTGNQCRQDGGFGTFRRNQHVKFCWNAADELCIESDQGRDLIHCGC